MSATSVLGIVPARGGSKGITRKNLVQLGGKPLLAYTLEAVAASSLLTRCVVSTDDTEIARVATELGAEVPFLRPDYLASDTARVNDVVRDLLRHLFTTVDYIMLLQPTAPLRSCDDIDAAIALAYEKNADSVVSLQEMETYHPSCMYYVEDERLYSVGDADTTIPRQEYRKVGWRNGAIYLVKKRVFLEEDQFVTSACVPYFMPPERSVNIDTEDDLRLAEYYLIRFAERSGKI